MGKGPSVPQRPAQRHTRTVRAPHVTVHDATCHRASVPATHPQPSPSAQPPMPARASPATHLPPTCSPWPPTCPRGAPTCHPPMPPTHRDHPPPTHCHHPPTPRHPMPIPCHAHAHAMPRSVTTSRTVTYAVSSSAGHSLTYRGGVCPSPSVITAGQDTPHPSPTVTVTERDRFFS